MAGYLNSNWSILLLSAIVCCSFINASAIEMTMNENDMRDGNVKKECILLDNYDFYVMESIKRSSFLYKLQIYGAVVSFTDIPDDSFCPGNIIIVEIFAVDKIIINDDYDALGEDVTFILAAPTWEVVDKRRINLRGHDAGEHERPSAYNGRRHGNRNGLHGKAGYPGGPGGYFYGIAVNVINMDQLTVRVQGGNGGHGQNGGNGVSGISGTTFDLSKDKIKRNGDVDGFDVILKRKLKPPQNETNLGEGIQEVVLGQKGTNGGHGGDGGVGGSGGLPGVYAFLNLQNKQCDRNSIFRDVEAGKRGRDGKGGKGGVAGYSGSDIVLDLFFSKGDEVLIRNAEYHEQEELLNGSNGLSGKSVEGEQNLREHPHWQNFLYTLDIYRDFLITNKDMSQDVRTVENVVIANVTRVMNNVRCMLSLVES